MLGLSTTMAGYAIDTAHDAARRPRRLVAHREPEPRGVQPVTWVKLRDDLERNTRAYGVGPTPLLSTGSLDQGLNVIRIDE